ncbi:hypothetical protein GCM10010403_29410 [Glycomyces rutgersensis]|uniref:Uncharacterized protein n=1 Tax=Glycomyces rutgersensis TaxID=58115 RepID=A0ABN3FQR1_9ACTN
MWLRSGWCWAGFDPAATTGQKDARVVWLRSGWYWAGSDPAATTRQEAALGCVVVPGRCWAGFRRAAMVRRIGAAVNIAAPLSAASAAVAGTFVECLSRRIGSGVHARGAVEAVFAIDFSPPFGYPEPLCGSPSFTA